MTTDWHSQAVNLFFHDYVIQPSESKMGIGYLQCLPDLWYTSAQDSALRLTVSAVALTSLANRSSCFGSLLPQASQRYGKALQQFTKSLTNQDDLKKDSTLATVFLFGIHEVCPFFEKEKGERGLQ